MRITKFPITQDEVDKILYLKSLEIPYRRIAQRMGRSYGAVARICANNHPLIARKKTENSSPADQGE